MRQAIIFRVGSCDRISRWQKEAMKHRPRAVSPTANEKKSEMSACKPEDRPSLFDQNMNNVI
jgi:hypothetical protein